MGLSKGEAYETLELPFGADQDSIRTSYKRLAMKWHPDKHKNSPESIKNFLEFSMAYKRLHMESDIVHMSVSDCLQLYQQTFSAPPPPPAFSNGFDGSDDDGDSVDELWGDEDDDDDDIGDYEYLFHTRITASVPKLQDGSNRNHLSAEQIEKNANELITEEEKEKRRSEKRRAKKKRRREKKRLEKAAEQQKKEDDHKKKTNKKESSADGKLKKDRRESDTSESEAEDFDQSAAFFTQVVSKKKKSAAGTEGTTVNTKIKSDVTTKTTNGTEDSLEDLDPVVLRSRQLAIEGNKMANLGHYQAAISLFSEAVKLDPRDFRFFGNRSYCFDRMQQYEKALKDAERAIQLAPDWPKGYFRKGRALAGLKLNADAEKAFMQVLKLDRNCEDAKSELLRVRTHQLTEMGFSQQQAQNALQQYDTVQQALDSLLAGFVAETSLGSEVYVSDEEDFGGVISSHAPGGVITAPTSSAPSSNGHSLASQLAEHPKLANNAALNKKPNDAKMDPKNPEGLTALWVGNVLPEVTEKKLHAMFSKYGQVTSVRPLPEKYCAFVNFKTKEAAGAAMKNLQSVPCAGQQLLIKFPDNPIANGTAPNSVVIRKTAPTQKPGASSSKTSQPATTNGQLSSSAVKLSGPVNGDECYFWRTTGCHYGKECHYRHVPEHKGLDRKPWQKGD